MIPFEQLETFFKDSPRNAVYDFLRLLRGMTQQQWDALDANQKNQAITLYWELVEAGIGNRDFKHPMRDALIERLNHNTDLKNFVRDAIKG